MAVYETKYAIGDIVWLIIPDRTYVHERVCPVCNGVGRWTWPNGIIQSCPGIGASGYTCDRGTLARIKDAWVTRESEIEGIEIYSDHEVYRYKGYDDIGWWNAHCDADGEPILYHTKEEAEAELVKLNGKCK